MEALHTPAAPVLTAEDRAARVEALGERVASGRATPEQLRRWGRVQELFEGARSRMEREGGEPWEA